MATSGTTAFQMNFTECAEEAYERAGIEMRSGYDLRTARRSLNLLLIEWNNRGINMWTIDQGTLTLTAGTASYTLPTDTVDLLEHVLRTGAGVYSTQQDRVLSRISVSTYAAIPNKLTQAPPLQILVNRLEVPTVTVWPVPDDSTTYQIIYWRMRRIEDVGIGVDTPDIVYRFYPALVAGLAYYLAMKRPEANARMPDLQAEYERQFQLAADEDREKAPQRWVPRRMFIGST